MAAVSVVRSTALVVALWLPVVAEAKIDRRDSVAAMASPVWAAIDWENSRCDDQAIVADDTAEVETPEGAPGETWTFEPISATDSGAPVVPNGGNPPTEPTSEHQGSVDADPVGGSPSENTAVKPELEQPPKKRAGNDLTIGPMAQFQLPPADVRGASGGPPRPVTQFLKYQYSYGSESDITYRRDPDLDRRLRDNTLTLAPQINGYVLYRPTDWMEMMLEMILEREIAAKEEKVVTLPNGDTRVAEKRLTSLVIDQAFVTFKLSGPLGLTVGRRNFEDDRHWLYDTSLDVAFLKYRQGNYNAEFSYGRKDLTNLDLLRPAPETRIDNYMLYMDYRGIEDIKLAGYAIRRDDRTGKEGKPLHLGVRASGAPSEKFNFWTELAFLRGKDESSRNFRAHAIDVGGTYRFPDLPLAPSVTLGYAYGSGDDNPNDNVNHQFRQTGLQSNEFKMSGVSKFKYYGEVLDPELSNLQIFTAGLGFRPAQSVFVDLVYHKYRLNQLPDQNRNWALTAELNQDSTQPPNKDVGSALDIVLGFRNLFGVRRLGLDLRAGWFFPGKAFRNDVTTDPDNPVFRRADKGISVLAKFWW